MERLSAEGQEKKRARRSTRSRDNTNTFAAALTLAESEARNFSCRNPSKREIPRRPPRRAPGNDTWRFFCTLLRRVLSQPAAGVAAQDTQKRSQFREVGEGLAAWRGYGAIEECPQRARTCGCRPRKGREGKARLERQANRD